MTNPPQHPVKGFIAALGAVAVLSIMDAVMKHLVLVIGLALLAIGIRRLKSGRFVPTRTIARLQHDAAVVAEHVRNDDEIPERAA